MGRWLAEQTVMEMIRAGATVKGARVGVLGLTFKENCADIRNSKVVDAIRELQSLGVQVLVHDPLASAEEAMHEYGIRLAAWEEMQDLDALVLAVAHADFVGAEERHSCLLPARGAGHGREVGTCRRQGAEGGAPLMAAMMSFPLQCRMGRVAR